MRRAGKISVLTCIAVISAAGSSLSAADTVSAAGDIMRTCESGIGTDTGRIGGKNISYLDAIGFEQMELDKNGGNVCLSMTIRLDSTKIRSQHTISLTPVITASDSTHEMEFGTVIVDGNTRHKVFLRRDLLEGTDPSRDSATVIIHRKNRSSQEYRFVSSVPYSRWMLGGSVIVRESVSGCADCGEGKSEKILDSQVLPRFIPDWKTSRIEPAPEPVKRREESRVARLQFRWDRYDIDPDWKGNRAVLDTVANSIAIVNEKDYIAITGIYVAGFASPEGPYEYNMNLSRNRAESFADYIAGNEGIVREMVTVEWGGEDWEGLKAQLQETDFPKRGEIAGTIDTFTADRNECETRMRSLLSQDEYRWLMRNIYPYLRHCTYRVEYTVKNFDLTEARKMIYDRPQDLNLNEIYRVAGSYSPDSQEYADAMSAAARFYPDSQAVLGDRALDALAEGNADTAMCILSGKAAALSWPANADETQDSDGISGKDAELLNIYGVAAASCGEYEKAEKALNTAAEAGCENARYNLGQLLGVMDQL